MIKKSGLGKGLDALINTEELHTEGSSSIREIDLSKIVPNKNQPRNSFDENALKDLSVSIKSLGIIQPVTLRQTKDGNYEIIAGERRFRASKMAGLTKIPAYIKTAEDDLVMEMALIENIQREDLNAIEIALSFQKLLEIYNMTQEQLSERLGKNRTTITNYLRLLKLPAEIQLGLKNHIIEMGHARALASINDTPLQLSLYEEIIKNGYSVRKVEELARTHTKKTDKKPKSTNAAKEYKELKELLSEKLKTKVKLTLNNKGKGSITIPFKSEKQLEELMKIFDKLSN